MDDMIEQKAPQDLIDLIPQERITGDILRGHGPRRGGLEKLLKYWRPIMRKPGGFRRCLVILADHPELYPLPPLCAWLHHETTGKWPNEGNHHGGGRAGRAAGRVARRIVPGKRRRRKKSGDVPVEMAAWRFHRRLARESKGALVAPHHGNQTLVEYKAARFQNGMVTVPIPANFGYLPEGVEEKVGLVSSDSGLGRFVQSIASIITPGDMGKIRSPIRSAIWSTLTPGGGSDRGGLGAAIGGAAARAMRCPAGYQNGGRFTTRGFGNCGALLFRVPKVGPGAVSGQDRNRIVDRLGAASAADVVAEVTGAPKKRDVFQIARDAALPAAKGPKRKQQNSAIDDVTEFLSGERSGKRVIRRDGVIYEPQMAMDKLSKLKGEDNLKEAAVVLVPPSKGKLGADEVPLLGTGVRSVKFAFPDGNVTLRRTGDVDAATLRKRWVAAMKDAGQGDPTDALISFVEAQDGVTMITKFGSIEDPDKRIRIESASGEQRLVPKWVFHLYLAENAPRRPSSRKPFKISDSNKPLEERIKA